MSYFEIYNNEGYDLIVDDSQVKNLHDLPRVIIRENQNKQFVLKNLKVLPVNSEDEALKFFFIGDMNRTIAETPKNDASTRSHCIFILQIESQKIGEDDKKNISKLHIVDLSGSESNNKLNKIKYKKRN
jgi:kinesin family protein 6/9